MFWRPEEAWAYTMTGFKGFNSGCFLTGYGGCGKSGVLTYVTAWAHENEWVVIAIPKGWEWVNHKGEEESNSDNPFVEWHKNGLYLQLDKAKEFLEDIAYSNEVAFSQIPVNLSIYGHYDQTGVHDMEGEPCPRVWDNRWKVWSDSWKEFLTPDELKYYENMDETFN